MVPQVDSTEGLMANKKEVAKKAGILVAVKKGLGKLTKLAVVAGIGAAVVKVLRRQES
ncbi:MAG: hypothetical protein WD080_03705 [Egibacteraceae bacterium]